MPFYVCLKPCRTMSGPLLCCARPESCHARSVPISSRATFKHIVPVTCQPGRLTPVVASMSQTGALPSLAEHSGARLASEIIKKQLHQIGHWTCTPRVKNFSPLGLNPAVVKIRSAHGKRAPECSAKRDLQKNPEFSRFITSSNILIVTDIIKNHAIPPRSAKEPRISHASSLATAII